MRFSPTPGGANLDEVPTGVLQRRTGCPSTGTGSYARSWAPSPVPPTSHTIHTSAEPAVVPVDVITALLDPNPNASVEVPWSESVGSPEPDTLYLKTRRAPPE